MQEGKNNRFRLSFAARKDGCIMHSASVIGKGRRENNRRGFGKAKGEKKLENNNLKSKYSKMEATHTNTHTRVGDNDKIT